MWRVEVFDSTRRWFPIPGRRFPSKGEALEYAETRLKLNPGWRFRVVKGGGN